MNGRTIFFAFLECVIYLGDRLLADDCRSRVGLLHLMHLLYLLLYRLDLRFRSALDWLTRRKVQWSVRQRILQIDEVMVNDAFLNYVGTSISINRL